ncbi:hypothetical protein [Nostoc sp.]
MPNQKRSPFIRLVRSLACCFEILDFQFISTLGKPDQPPPMPDSPKIRAP